MNIKTLITLVTFSCFIFCSFAQNTSPAVVASSGDHYTNTQGSVSWTLGEIATETYSNSNNHLTQGFQQPQLVLTSLSENINSSNVTFYPNPVKEKLIVNISALASGVYSFELTDLSGKIISTSQHIKSTSNQSVVVDLSNIANAFYILNVFDATHSTKESFKITKTE